MEANSACQEAKEALARCFFAMEMTNRRKVEGALQPNEDRHRHLLQQMPGFVAVLTGPNHVYEYVNDAYVAIAGPRRRLRHYPNDVLEAAESLWREAAQAVADYRANHP